MKKVTPKLKFGLILLVVLFNCCKKEMVDSNGAIAGYTSTSNTVVVAPNPSTVISGDLIALNPGGGSIIVATQSDYNSMVYSDKIYNSGLQAAVNYLFSSGTNNSTALRYNIDGTYSIVVNPTTTSEAVLQCNACTPGTLSKCFIEIDKYMRRNNLKSVNSTITKNSNGCMTIRYSFSSTITPSVNTNGGTLVQTYTPTLTYLNSDFNSYINSVTHWAFPRVNIYLPANVLFSYINSFNEDAVHPVITNQNNDVFQAQLAYYVFNIRPAIPPIPSLPPRPGFPTHP